MLAERHLIIISLCTSLLGIGALVILSVTVELPKEHIEVISHERVDETVRVEAEILSVRHVKNVTILSLGAMVEKKGVIFERVNLTKGMDVELIGTISEYQGEAEMVIDQVLVQ
jgi:DNA/RNA endonuclease YhcR with UshA esterase domain